jgi:hypothetical protein
MGRTLLERPAAGNFKNVHAALPLPQRVCCGVRNTGFAQLKFHTGIGLPIIEPSFTRRPDEPKPRERK